MRSSGRFLNPNLKNSKVFLKETNHSTGTNDKLLVNTDVMSFFSLFFSSIVIHCYSVLSLLIQSCAGSQLICRTLPDPLWRDGEEERERERERVRERESA